MATKKQSDSNARELTEVVNDWFREFLKHLEIYMANTGQSLPANAATKEFCLAALRAVKLTLSDSGLDEDEIVQLLGRVAVEKESVGKEPVWNATLNKRRIGPSPLCAAAGAIPLRSDRRGVGTGRSVP